MTVSQGSLTLEWIHPLHVASLDNFLWGVPGAVQYAKQWCSEFMKTPWSRCRPRFLSEGQEQK